LKLLPAYEWGPQRNALVPIDVAAVASHDNARLRASLEERLLEVLRSEATVAAKGYACQKLAEMGTSRSVDTVASLLGDEALGHAARRVLEAVGGEASLEALSKALPKLDGPLKIGVVQSLGKLRDRQSATELVALLNHGDDDLVRTAVEALGQIDVPEAQQAVLKYYGRASKENRPAASHACLKIADRMLSKGHNTEAADVYEMLESATEPWLGLAVFRGQVLAEPDQSEKRILAALAGDDEPLRRMAAQFARDAGDPKRAAMFAEAIPGLPIQGQILLLDALSRRDLAEVRTAALNALGTESEELHEVALRALGYSGQASEVARLVDFAVHGSSSQRIAARQSLERLQGEGVDDALAQLLPSAKPMAAVVLIQTLAARSFSDTVPLLLGSAKSPSTEVRQAALAALEKLATPDEATQLIEFLLRSSRGAEREAAERAVWRCCARIEDPLRRAEPLLDCWKSASQAQRAVLLPALGRVGGASALPMVKRSLEDPQLRDAAVRALSNWPDATVADELIQLARAGDKPEYRIWALRGFARVVAREGRAHPQRTFEQLREAMQLATRVEDRKLVLSRLTATRVPGALELSQACLQEEPLRADAIEVVASLAEGMKETHPAEARVALERIQPLTTDQNLQLKIAKLLWNMQLKGQ
jgi:HEAT repeat protein